MDKTPVLLIWEEYDLICKCNGKFVNEMNDDDETDEEIEAIDEALNWLDASADVRSSSRAF